MFHVAELILLSDTPIGHEQLDEEVTCCFHAWLDNSYERSLT